MGSFLDLGEHDLLIAVYSCVVCQFFEFLEELVGVLEVGLPELFPLCMFNLQVGVLPESLPDFFLEVGI